MSLPVNNRIFLAHPRTDEDLITAFVKATSGYSLREAGAFVGVSRGSIQRWRRGEIGDLQPATRRAVSDWLGKQSGVWADDPPPEAQVIFVDPNTLRRMVGSIKPEDRRSRLMMFQAVEARYVEEGYPIPTWLEEMKREMLGGGTA